MRLKNRNRTVCNLSEGMTPYTITVFIDCHRYRATLIQPHYLIESQ